METSLPLWSCIPFAGMLLSIAIFPLIKGVWWEKHQLHVAVFWSLLFLVPFTAVFGWHEAQHHMMEVIILDYIPFITLLLGLFVVAGGIQIKGTLSGSTKCNVGLLGLGTFLASWVGTTGAAMLLIRPVLRANAWRKKKAHIVVFFIFLVANIGGCLTPLGDPPLFLGYLRGVPFFWTMRHIWPLLVVNTIALLVLFAALDRFMLRKEESQQNPEAGDGEPLSLAGAHNLLYLALIILGVVLNGAIPQTAACIDSATGLVYGVALAEGMHLGFNYFLQLGMIVLAIVLSLRTTHEDIRKANGFEWEPIAEVARLFIGIFITMIPALLILRAQGGELGLDTPLELFWTTGLLSSFLDNSPTYVVFLTVGGALGAGGLAGAVPTTVGVVDPALLLAVSAGAVFMGAVTYIGNAPNFMVKTIAERSGIKMPSFFGYIGWSFAILTPVFILDSLLFFA